ncbi:unnamed protein product [Larinioides sclopetarius]|uniref:DDE Tnp4 domain-containing protein n=1 Tax=Larinioides sclopetarius TaxID=280406 RepID=A0AAV2ADG3_9ARAC
MANYPSGPHLQELTTCSKKLATFPAIPKLPHAPHKGGKRDVTDLCSLRLFAGGSYQKFVVNDILNCVSQQRVSNCLRSVTEAINNLLLDEVAQFPVFKSDRNLLKVEFFNYSGFPGAIGAIDYTHVAIVASPDDGEYHEKNYVNREGYHSINVQLLMTPSDGSSRMEKMYDIAHKRGRSVIERCNGVLKARFRCLSKHRTLHYNPTFAGAIINACVVLHNMCVSKGLLIEEEIEMEEPFDTGFLNHATKNESKDHEFL